MAKSFLRELKVEDALLYLDQVKMAFGDKPEIYNEFLDIMKNFKAQEIDTPGVIQQVSHLFQGYNKLILGFNTFLPDGYKIELPVEEGENATLTVLTPSGVQASSHISQESYNVTRTQDVRALHSNASAVDSLDNTSHAAARQSNAQVDEEVCAMEASRIARSPTTTSICHGGAPVEFDHAITYVTTIKKRFAHEPETYKAFLEILHTYQKEQRSIKDVLEQVSELFADHADLLKEFTYFLPDAVQEQAKERLSRAVRENELRSDTLIVPPAATPSSVIPSDGTSSSLKKSAGGTDHKSRRLGATSGDASFEVRGKSASTRVNLQEQSVNLVAANIRGTFVSRTSGADSAASCNMAVGAPRGTKVGSSSTTLALSSTGQSVAGDRHFFDRVRDVLTSGASRDCWSEFLKCLDLYTQGLVLRQEMLRLVTDMFGKHMDLFDEFKRMLHSHSTPEKASHHNHLSAKGQSTMTSLSEVDFSHTNQCTPSYRALPIDCPRPSSSECSPVDRACLNDVWVSQPVGSEESYSFKHMRKNQYEEALFRCEDNHFELDMVIESNQATIAALHHLYPDSRDEARDVNVKEGGHNLQVDERALSSLHRSAILRIYGEHGPELLELLNRSPMMTIPVVVKRLREKDAEWRRVRQEITVQCKEQLDRNYHRALDHRSFVFKQRDKRLLVARSLLNEITAPATSTASGSRMASQTVAQSRSESSAGIHDTDDSSQHRLQQNVFNVSGGESHLTCFRSISLHHHDSLTRIVYHLVIYALERSSIAADDKTRALYIWNLILSRFYSADAVESVRGAVAGTQTAASDLQAAEGSCVQSLQYPPPCNPILREQDNLAVLDSIALPQATRNVTCKDTVKALGCPLSATDKAIPSDLLKVSHISLELQERPERYFIGTQHTYTLLRLFHILCERLGLAWCLAQNASQHSLVSPFPLLHMCEHASNPQTGAAVFEDVLLLLYALIDGSTDNTRFEECLRQLLGNESYALYTLDKVVVQIGKHLHAMTNDTRCCKLINLWQLYCSDFPSQSFPGAEPKHHDIVLGGKFGSYPSLLRVHARHIMNGLGNNDDLFGFQHIVSTTSSEIVITHLPTVHEGASAPTHSATGVSSQEL
eukprot:CAMPEP_0185700544 /NCGR_PEP_ID=MMETSP1164-20130828/7548_1 /TAXON_ID=1104430 /ORGANISM="Chrysoreinhardia sp, Strain CCMP2950" /LENGTH=1111 /DNA_ID=CAMNT_0028367495 /DNA_START=182 /DNA_END=3517 /DNA_ORIENTATION=+